MGSPLNNNGLKGRSVHWPNFSGIFDLCLHWVSVVRDPANSAQWDTYLATTFFDHVVSIGD